MAPSSKGASSTHYQNAFTHKRRQNRRVQAASTGERTPLLHIVPSKTDAERLLVISPELADVLSIMIKRVSDEEGAVPLVVAYDYHDRVWNPP